MSSIRLGIPLDVYIRNLGVSKFRVVSAKMIRYSNPVIPVTMEFTLASPKQKASEKLSYNLMKTRKGALALRTDP